MSETVQERKATAFSALHRGEPFIIPNPWDAGSAKVPPRIGRPGNGHGPEPEDAARAIERVAEAGAVGGSIEDWDPDGHLYSLEHAAERIAAAREVSRRLGFPFTLTARAENHLRGNPDLENTIARLQAYARAGADVLYAPGLATVEEIRALCAAVPKPVNVLARPDLKMRDIAEAGAQRVSVGGALTWAAVEAMASAAERMRDDGDFSALASPRRIRNWLSFS